MLNVNSPDKFLERTQNICRHCGTKIFWLGGSWKHRRGSTMFCNDLHPDYEMTRQEISQRAEPKFKEGSVEHLKAIHT